MGRAAKYTRPLTGRQSAEALPPHTSPRLVLARASHPPCIRAESPPNPAWTKSRRQVLSVCLQRWWGDDHVRERLQKVQKGREQPSLASPSIPGCAFVRCRRPLLPEVPQGSSPYCLDCKHPGILSTLSTGACVRSQQTGPSTLAVRAILSPQQDHSTVGRARSVAINGPSRSRHHGFSLHHPRSTLPRARFVDA